MGSVVITCPNTGKPVATGFDMDQASFDNAELSYNTFGPCPECGEMHTWSKGDASVQDD